MERLGAETPHCWWDFRSRSGDGVYRATSRDRARNGFRRADSRKNDNSRPALRLRVANIWNFAKSRHGSLRIECPFSVWKVEAWEFFLLGGHSLGVPGLGGAENLQGSQELPDWASGSGLC